MSAERSAPHPGMSFMQFVIMMALLMAIGAMGLDGMLPSLPVIAHDLRIETPNARQLVVTVYGLSMGVAQIIYGPLMDRYGRKPVLLVGLAGFAVFSVFSAVATSLPILILARCLQGASIAAARVGSVSIIRDSYEGRRMAQVMSLCMLVFMAAPVFAPSIGQAIALVGSWRWFFGVLGIAASGIALWARVKLPETLHSEDRRKINFGEITSAFATTMRSRQGMGYTLAGTMIFGALFGFLNSASQVVVDALHAPQLFTVIFASVSAFVAVASLLSARLVQRFGSRLLSHAALIASIAVAGVHVAVSLYGHESVVSFVILLGCSMFCFGLMAGNFGALAIEPLGHIAGSAASAQGFISVVGGSIVGFAIGQSFDGTVVPLVSGYLGCCMAALVIIMFTEHGRLFRSAEVEGQVGA